MKTVRNFLLIVVSVLLLSGCGNNNLKSLSYKELNKKMENGDTFFFEVVQDGCSHCANFTPKLKEVLNEYDVIGYQLNITNLSSEDYDAFYSKFGISSTPTTVFITNGEESSVLQRIDGNVSKDKIIAKLKSNNYIK